MALLPILKVTAILAALFRAGFITVRSKGSHFRLQHPFTHRMVTISFHRGDVQRKMLNSILKQAGISIEQFLKHLK